MKLIRFILNSIYSNLILGFGHNKKILNAHKILNENNKIEIIDKICLEIEKCNIFYNKNDFLKINKYFDNEQNYDITLNQIIHHKYILGRFFCSKLSICMAFNNTFFYPLPTEWLKVIDNNNIKVNFLLSKTLFYISIIYFFFIDFLKIVLNFFSKNKTFKNNRTIVYLDAIPKLDLEYSLKNMKYNYLLWCKDFLKINQGVTFVHNNKEIPDKVFQDIEIVYIKNFFLSNLNIYERFYYLKTFIFSLIIFIMYIFKGNIRHLFLLENFFTLIWLNNFKSKLPNYAIYNNSGCWIRPWWTFLLDKKQDKKIFMSFYSTNHFPFYSYNRSFLGCRLWNWPHYIFWTNEQSFYLKNITKKFIGYDVVGYFPYFGKNITITKKKKFISLFPVTPFNDKFNAETAVTGNLYTIENSTNFIKQILEAVQVSNIEIIIKLKRYNPDTHPEYIKFLENLKKDKRIIFIDPKISAISIIDQSNIVISQPYSSPSLIANYFNIPSIYYDCSNSLNEEPYSKKVKLLKNNYELSEWINNNIN